jgi:tRNA nucleotidyltransferase (CCA-adding enzyme)
VHERGTHVTVVELPRPELVDDTLYPQVRKAERAIAEEIGRSEFTVLNSSCAVDPHRVLVLLEVAHPHRPAVRFQDGPPAGLDRVGQYLEKWGAPDAPVLQGPYVRADGSLAVETRRVDRDVEAVLRSAMPRLSLGRDLTPTPARPFRVHPLAAVEESTGLSSGLDDLLGKRLPWSPRP